MTVKEMITEEKTKKAIRAACLKFHYDALRICFNKDVWNDRLNEITNATYHEIKNIEASQKGNDNAKSV